MDHIRLSLALFAAFGLAFTQEARSEENLPSSESGVRVVCCPGDMDSSGQVNETDLPLFVFVLLNQSGTPEQLCAVDVNADGLGDGRDISAFSAKILSGGACIGGACCQNGGTCQVSTQSQCNAASGCYQGDGTTCAACACAAGRCDMDGLCSNGCEVNVNNNPGCSPVFLGSVSGDTGNDVLSRSGIGEAFYRVRVTENNNSALYLSAHIDLLSGPNSNYNLLVYCVSCGAFIGQSSNGTGAHDVFDVRNDDDFGFADDFDIIIEVRWASGGCDGWQLTVTGNLAAANNNCDP